MWSYYLCNLLTHVAFKASYFMWCILFMQEKLKCVPVFESHDGEVSRNFMLGTSLS